ncbi:hypothetical protein [Paenibacillus ottowii]|nr:hypothetical protein [Paenibacillus ottowii]
MKLAQLAGEYDAVFSLGQNCTPAIQLEKKPFAAVCRGAGLDDV